MPADADLRAVVTPIQEGAAFDAEVVDVAGKVFLSLRGYKTTALSSVATPWAVADAEAGASVDKRQVSTGATVESTKA